MYEMYIDLFLLSSLYPNQFIYSILYEIQVTLLTSCSRLALYIVCYHSNTHMSVNCSASKQGRLINTKNIFINTQNISFITLTNGIYVMVDEYISDKTSDFCFTVSVILRHSYVIHANEYSTQSLAMVQRKCS